MLDDDFVRECQIVGRRPESSCPDRTVLLPAVVNMCACVIAGGVEEAGGLKASLFNKALEAKKEALRSGNTTRCV